MQKHGLWNKLIQYAQDHPIFGTCAGLIILAKQTNGNALTTLGLIDIEVDRNAYGRQIDSFIDNVQGKLNNKSFELEGIFIRAPKIKKIGKDVRALAWHDKNVVMAESEQILVATFHPELADNSIIHEYFCEKVANYRK